MREKELVKLRKKVYQLLKVNDATNKVSWWNLADDVVDLIVSERERVIGEIRMEEMEWAEPLVGSELETWNRAVKYFNDKINKLKKGVDSTS